MKQEIKAQWLTALRSGEYRQGEGYLHRGDEFCCLGVLCDLAEKAGVVEFGHVDGWAEGIVLYGEDAHVGDLPLEVQEWSGIDTDLADVGDIEEADGDWIGKSLAEANDDGFTFGMIADIIEERL